MNANDGGTGVSARTTHFMEEAILRSILIQDRQNPSAGNEVLCSRAGLACSGS
ncbi:MAG: hypothetical protein ACLVCW_00305 [Campylobacter sp.]